MKKPSDIEVIQKLGGVKSISEILGVPYTTVNNWKSRGIAASAKMNIQNISCLERSMISSRLLSL